MRGKTHIAAGAAIGLFISSSLTLSVSDTLAVTTCTAACALLPDIDNATSKLGRLFAPASILIQLFFGHRTLFHAPLLYLVLSFVIAQAYPSQQLLILSCAAGITSHLILDMLNPAGIPLFWPIRRRIHLAPFHSGGLVDRLLGTVLWLITVFQAFSMLASTFR